MKCEYESFKEHYAPEISIQFFHMQLCFTLDFDDSEEKSNNFTNIMNPGVSEKNNLKTEMENLTHNAEDDSEDNCEGLE